MHVEPRLQDSALLFAFEGWNDAGESATSALEFVNEAIRAAPLADIDPEEFYDFTVSRPEVAVSPDHRRSICWPSNTFRFGPVSESRELVTCLGVEPHLRWRSFCDCMVEVASRVGVHQIVMLGSYLADVVYSQPVQVTGFASRPEVLEDLGVSASSYQGPTGIVGVLADRLEREGFEVVSLWAGLPHYINIRPNPRGALALVRKLVRCLDLKLDEESLSARAIEFEGRISRLVAGDPELEDYVKQLKRREFAL
ncbi:MAG: PAC2 family protein [Deltaproteobacteria bacterium]|nr:PAC2 family protein [Deltaproteobacteria bacterium]